MKKSRLLVLSLLAVGAIGLTSLVMSILYMNGCTFTPIAGEKGETGAKGEKGEKGDKGDKGETGATGSQGAKGEKGDKGEKGEKGDTGYTGSKGAKGDTAYSNTILPSEGGYVFSSVGSALKGEEVTFTINLTDSYKKIFSLVINGESVNNTDLKVVDNDKTKYTYTTTMVENGFVVEAKFYNTLQEALYDGGNLTLLKDIDSSSITIPGTFKGSNKDSISIMNKKEVKPFGQAIKTELIINKDTNLNLNNFDIDLDSSTLLLKDGAKFNITNLNPKTISTIETESTTYLIKVESSSSKKSILEIGPSVYLNLNQDGTTIELNNSSLFLYGTVQSSEGTAIKQTGEESTIIVNEQSSVIGNKNGLQVEGGTLFVNGGTIKTVADSFEESTKTGAALAIVPTDTSEVYVKVDSGNLIANGTSYAIYQKNATSDTEGTKVNLNLGAVNLKSDNETSPIVVDVKINTVVKDKYFFNGGHILIEEIQSDKTYINYTFINDEDYELDSFKVVYKDKVTEVTKDKLQTFIMGLSQVEGYYQYQTEKVIEGMIVSAVFKTTLTPQKALEKGIKDGTVKDITFDEIKRKTSIELDQDNEIYEVNAYKSYVYLLNQGIDVKELNNKLIALEGEKTSILVFNKDGQLVKIKGDDDNMYDENDDEIEDTSEYVLFVKEEDSGSNPDAFEGVVVILGNYE